MKETWTDLEVDIHDNATISVSKWSWYEWDDNGDEIIVYKDMTVSLWDVYVAIANSMVDCVCPLYEDGPNDSYGTWAFIALCNGTNNGFHGYSMNDDDLTTLNERGTVMLTPLIPEWDEDVKAAVELFYKEV